MENVITEPAAVAALKEIHQNNGPGNLKWDFSIPGQVRARDYLLEARDGALASLALHDAELSGVLKLHGLETLAILKASGNDFHGVDFQNLPRLNFLSLSGTKISDIGPLAKLAALTSLRLHDTIITDLGPLAGLTALRQLSLSGQGLSDLSPLAGLTALEGLYLDVKETVDLAPLARLTTLRTLIIPPNRISDLGPLSAGLKKLQRLSYVGQLQSILPFEERFKCFRPAAEQGLPVAQYELGVALSEYGDRAGVKKDGAEAVKWLRLAAEQEHAEARYLLGQAYEFGKGIEKDKAEAAKWYRLAAVQGHSYAQFSIGRAYYLGDGVAEDKAEAVKWFRLAAERDDGDGAPWFYLGQAYRLGAGVEEDKAEAVRLFRRAAEYEYAEARLSLGYAYALGEGVAQDEAEAAKWFRLAADGGGEDSFDEVSDFALYSY